MPGEKRFDDGPIFVVDDDAAVSRSIQRLLKAHGFDARTFDSAAEFRAVPDPNAGLCLVLDVDLKAESGLELSHQLSASGSLLPVIFISANATRHAQRSAVASGCLAYLTKPFSSRSLLQAIDRAITLRTKNSIGPAAQSEIRSLVEAAGPGIEPGSADDEKK